MITALRSFWHEPRPAPPATPSMVDRVLVALLLPVVLAEGLLRDGLVWRPLAIALSVGLVLALLFRRSHPFATLAAALLTTLLVELAAMVFDVAWTGLGSAAIVLLLPYSLLRWGSGRQGVLGVGLMVLLFGVTLLRGEIASVEEGVGGAVVFLFPAALGASVRFRASAFARDLERTKLLERSRLARELHDTVAHHVSAITVQAQAGRAVFATQPEQSLAILGEIEAEAKRTLADLRGIVGALRSDEGAEHAPPRGLDDVRSLAREAVGGPAVEVVLAGALAGLPPSIEAAIYRIAQESVTNALRHARGASRVVVRVEGEPERVAVTVEDDGARPRERRAGFGLVGMAERAALLGGTLEAGPGPERGWRVSASLPRKGTP